MSEAICPQEEPCMRDKTFLTHGGPNQRTATGPVREVRTDICGLRLWYVTQTHFDILSCMLIWALTQDFV